MNITAVFIFLMIVCGGVLSLARFSAVGGEGKAGASGFVVLRETRNKDASAQLAPQDRDWERGAKYALSVYPLAAQQPVGEAQKLRLDLASGSVRVVNQGGAVAVFLDLKPGVLSASAEQTVNQVLALESGMQTSGRQACPVATGSAVSLCAVAAREADQNLDARSELARVGVAYGAAPAQKFLPQLATRWAADRSGLGASLQWQLASASPGTTGLAGPLSNNSAVFILEVAK